MHKPGGGGSASSTTASSAASGSAAASADGDVTIRMTWWGGQTRHDLTQQLLDKYTELNPNVHFETTPSGWDGYFEKLATDTATGGMADIVQMDYMYISTYAKNGSLADLSEYASNGTLDISNVDDALMDAGTIDGKMVGIPLSTSLVSFIYNPSVLEEAGVEAPKNGWTWNNFGTIGANAGNDTLELLVPPVKKAGEKALWYKPGMFFSVAETSKVKDAAAAFISWFLNSDEANDIMLGERGTPSASTARDHLTSSGALSEKQVEMFDFVSDAADYCGSTPAPDPSGISEVNTQFKDIAYSVFYGQATPAEAAQTFFDTANSILAANN